VFFDGTRQGRVQLEGDFIEEHGWPSLSCEHSHIVRPTSAVCIELLEARGWDD
jgi:hypothetical protein